MPSKDFFHSDFFSFIVVLAFEQQLLFGADFLCVTVP